MSAVWDRKDLDPSERLVMLSLADHADDDGYCYPSIKRLCERSSLSERTVQSTIKKLVGRGFLTVNYGAGRNGTNVFIISATPANLAPPQISHPAADAPRKSRTTPPQISHLPPATVAPKPSRTIKEPSDNNTGEAVACLAEVVGEDLAKAFVAHRKASKSPLTVGASQLIAKKLAGFADPAAAIETSIMNGWKGVFPERPPPAAAAPTVPRIRAQLPQQN